MEPLRTQSMGPASTVVVLGCGTGANMGAGTAMGVGTGGVGMGGLTVVVPSRISMQASPELVQTEPGAHVTWQERALLPSGAIDAGTGVATGAATTIGEGNMGRGRGGGGCGGLPLVPIVTTSAAVLRHIVPSTIDTDESNVPEYWTPTAHRFTDC